MKPAELGNSRMTMIWRSPGVREELLKFRKMGLKRTHDK